jgi:hypothetical protein
VQTATGEFVAPGPRERCCLEFAAAPGVSRATVFRAPDVFVLRSDHTLTSTTTVSQSIGHAAISPLN